MRKYSFLFILFFSFLTCEGQENEIYFNTSTIEINQNNKLEVDFLKENLKNRLNINNIIDENLWIKTENSIFKYPDIEIYNILKGNKNLNYKILILSLKKIEEFTYEIKLCLTNKDTDFIDIKLI